MSDTPSYQVSNNVMQGSAVVIGDGARVTVNSDELAVNDAAALDALLSALLREAFDDADCRAIEVAAEAVRQRRRTSLLAAVSSFSSSLLATSVGAALADIVRRL